MKTLEEILQTPPIYLGYWSDDSGLLQDFRIESLDGHKVILAYYDSDGSWGGNSYVLTQKDGELFESSGGHCSCYGLEDQFDPSPACLPELVQRFTKGESYRDDDYGKEMRELLGI